MTAMPEFILYVADQTRAREFYTAVLGQDPVLDVPGMTEFDLGGALLGLMPAADIAELLGVELSGDGQRCELYLRRPDAVDVLARAAAAGGRILSPLSPRPWGETAGYALDPDAHVLAVALPVPSPTNTP
jgi:catechol 2,3-dioxygenase-like lactoylglutathione lyase family enzyme